MRSPDGVYLIGRFREDDRMHARSWLYDFHAAAGNPVRLRVEGASLADRYVGAVVPREDLLGPVVTPAGARAAPLATAFEAECFAIPLTGGRDGWRDLEISVGVEVEGLPPFRYAYSPADPPDRVEMWTTKPPVPR